MHQHAMEQSAQSDAKHKQLLQELEATKLQLDLLAQGGQNSHQEMEALRRQIAHLEAKNAAFATSISQAIGHASSMFSEGMQIQIEAHQQAVEGILSALQRLATMPSQATPTQVTNILHQYNVPMSSHVNMIALGIAQGRRDPQELRAILDREGPTAEHAPTEDPMIVMGPGGMPGDTFKASFEPLVPIAPDGIPVIDIAGEVLPHAVEFPSERMIKVSAPRVKRRMSLRYHKRRAKAVMAVLRGKKSAEQAREELAQLKSRRTQPEDEPEPDAEPSVEPARFVRRTIDKRAEKEMREYKKSRPIKPSEATSMDMRNKRVSEDETQPPQKRLRATPSQAPPRPSQAPIRPSKAPPRPTSRPPRPSKAPPPKPTRAVNSIFKTPKRVLPSQAPVTSQASSSATSLVRPSRKPKAKPSQRPPRPSQAP
jgi:hypothetical protein